MGQPHFIVFANEKGGTGKSTTAVHTAIALAASGHSVGALDLDQRQRTHDPLSRKSRRDRCAGSTSELPHAGLRECSRTRAKPASRPRCAARRRRRRHRHRHARPRRPDRPRGDHHGRYAGHADERQFRRPRPDRPGRPENYKVHQAELLCRADLEQPHPARQGAPARASTGSCSAIASSMSSRTISRVGEALDELARRVGFRVIPGLGERVIYRELFPKGLTLLDLATSTHIAARRSRSDRRPHCRPGAGVARE